MTFNTSNLPIYIPSEDSMESSPLAPGTAIVGIKFVDESKTFVLGYYEGNIYNADNIKTFEDKCMFAAGRGVQKAPTTAFQLFNVNEIKQVGEYDYTSHKANISDRDAVELWENFDDSPSCQMTP